MSGHSLIIITVILAVLFGIWILKSRVKEGFSSFTGMPMPPLVMTDTIAVMP